MKHFKQSLHILAWMYVLCFISIELLFRSLNQFYGWDDVMVRILLFSVSTALFIYTLSLFLPKKLQLIVLNLSLFVLAGLGLSQISFKAYMNANYSLGLFFSMFTRIQDYAGDFFHYIQFEQFLIFIPFLVFMGFSIKTQAKTKQPVKLIPLISLCLSVLLAHTLAILSFTWFEDDTLPIQVSELYQNPYIPELSLYQLGLSQFIQQDLKSLVFNPTVLIPEPPIEVIPSEPVVVVPNFERMINDQAWEVIMKSETN